MAQVIIYANGETTGSSFHLSSDWTCVYGSDGQQIRYGPTIGSATYTYSLSAQPAGAKIDRATVYARIAARGYSPKSGIASGFPRANGVQMTHVSGSSDECLYSANISFEDASVTTKVTYSFKAAGDSNVEGMHSGTLTFDDVYLLIDYTPPCSDWSLSTTSEYAGETIWADIVMTDDNQDYTHKVVVSCDSGQLFTGTGSPGQSRIWIVLNSSWMEQFPNTTAGKATAVLETYNANGILLGTSEPVEIEILCPEDMVPSTGSLTVTGTHMFGPLYLQGISSVTAAASGWIGVYGSTIETVVLTGNGKTATLDMSTGATTHSASLTLDAGLLKAAGVVSFTLTVTDSRGRISSVIQEIDVTSYSPVSIKSTAHGRVTREDSSTYDSGYVKLEYDYTALTYQSGATVYYNTPALTIYWGTNSVVVDGYASKTQQRFAEDDTNGLRKDSMYTVRLHLTDGISNTTVTRTIGTTHAFMRWDPARSAIGFGCYPQQEKCVEIGTDWSLIVNNDIQIPDANQQLISLRQFILEHIDDS